MSPKEISIKPKISTNNRRLKISTNNRRSKISTNQCFFLLTELWESHKQCRLLISENEIWTSIITFTDKRVTNTHPVNIIQIWRNNSLFQRKCYIKLKESILTLPVNTESSTTWRPQFGEGQENVNLSQSLNLSSIVSCIVTRSSSAVSSWRIVCR